jgi:hypothetical protein
MPPRKQAAVNSTKVETSSKAINSDSEETHYSDNDNSNNEDSDNNIKSLRKIDTESEAEESDKEFIVKNLKKSTKQPKLVKKDEDETEKNFVTNPKKQRAKKSKNSENENSSEEEKTSSNGFNIEEYKTAIETSISSLLKQNKNKAITDSLTTLQNKVTDLFKNLNNNANVSTKTTKSDKKTNNKIDVSDNLKELLSIKTGQVTRETLLKRVGEKFKEHQNNDESTKTKIIYDLSDNMISTLSNLGIDNLPSKIAKGDLVEKLLTI